MQYPKIQIIPVSMALAYLQLQDKLTSIETHECSRKFYEYLSKFKKTSTKDYAIHLQKFFNKMIEKHPTLQKQLIQIWNLDLRSSDDIGQLFPKVSKLLSIDQIESIVKQIQSKNK